MIRSSAHAPRLAPASAPSRDAVAAPAAGRAEASAPDAIESTSARRAQQKALGLEASAPAGRAGVRRRAIPGSFIVGVPSDGGEERLAALGLTLAPPKSLGRLERGQDSLTLFEVQSAQGLAALRQSLREAGGPTFVAPNYAYTGDVLDAGAESPAAPNDPRLKEQLHHRLTRAIEAGAKSPGRPEIVVAVTDTGVDFTHEDLRDAIWTNPGEIPDNGKDDDGNGYVDDVRGWDVCDDDNNVLGWQDHGTHVAGIVGAVRDNGVGVVGTAAGVRIMPIKWTSDNDNPWTSAVIAKAFLYAANNGARIINSSFNSDAWPGDKVVEEAIAYTAEKGLIHVNSAGNNGARNPRRTALEDVVFVASTVSDGKKDDTRSSFSNYGAGVDIAAPGSDILSTIPSNGYRKASGTSMASPNGAAAVAMVWSAHPEWNREQVYAQVRGTTDPIDDVNPGNRGELGSGRINVLRAVSETLAPPRLQVERLGKILKVRLSSVLDLKQANLPSSWRIERVDSGELVREGPPARVRLATNELVFKLDGLAPGAYRLVADATSLRDPFGQALDGNGDGVAGDSLVFDFEVA